LDRSLAAFMATKPAGGSDLHPAGSAGPERERRMAEAGDFVSRWKGGGRGPATPASWGNTGAGKSSAVAIAGTARLLADRPLEGLAADPLSTV